MTEKPGAVGVLERLLSQGFAGFHSSDPAAMLRERADREEIRELTAR
jgi:hypothetical protein